MIDIGVVMPVYNQVPAYLRIALNSMLKQTYRQFKLVIVLDGANLPTQQIARRFAARDHRVTILHKPRNQGLASALNDGFARLYKIPSIRYLTWVSSDNDYFPPFLATLRRRMIMSPPKIGLVYSAFRYIDAQGKPMYTRAFYQQLRQRQRLPKRHLLHHCFIGASFLYRKSVAQKVGNYRLEPVEDYDYWLRMSEICDIRFIPPILMAYRHRSPNSVSTELETPEGKDRFRQSLQQALREARQRRGMISQDINDEMIQTFIQENHLTIFRP
ncbi:Glycosyl transferase family 2 [Marininema mesophilum]|uniref:Glycosyl transferase family 2 n=1 Tax=Marininema mesophilum TaxID=1048340 RepID=A0A1H2VND3_9BACL|nr:glycosyltransferase family 2 protein [Marininema mesophilum]SDW69399.1 Glycosyl transferase family 2 [Marininema mesophilum]